MARDLFTRAPGLRLLVYRLVVHGAPLLPLPLARFLSCLVGHLVWFCDRRGRGVVADNLAPALPRGRPRALFRSVHRSYMELCLGLADGLHMHRLPPSLAQDMEIVDPWGAFRDRPLRGPCITCTLHCNWELLPPLMHGRGCVDGVTALTLSHEDPRIDRLVERFRAATGVRSILLDEAPLASLRALHNGEVLGIVGDRNYSHHGISVRVLGRELSLPIGPGALAVQTGAPIVPVMLARRQRTRFMVLVGRPLRADPARPKRDEVARLSQALAAWYERCIRAAPPQWIAFHPVWRREGPAPAPTTASARLASVRIATTAPA